MNNLTELRAQIERSKGKQSELENRLSSLKGKIRESKKELILLEKARVILQMVGLETQQQLQFHISDIASLALESVFPDPYKLVLDFVDRRGKTECDILFERDGKLIKPIDASGGGTVDVASFALRIASWSMSIKKIRNTIILDEPLRFLSAEYQEAASQMIKEISKKLGIQFIIVTHNPVLTSYADRVFEVKLRRKISKIKTI